jgi:protein-tyrosine phosphatase
MEGYIDIHSHILPHLDDGAKNIEESIKMAKIAYKEGIRTIIATPHYHLGRGVIAIDIMENSLRKVKKELNIIMPQMKVLLGCEIYYSHDIIRLLKEKEILTLADSNYILVEFPITVEYHYMKNAIQDILLEGYIPIIAHIERYTNIIKDMDDIRAFIDMGAYVQINTNSITGDAGRVYKKITKKLLNDNCVHFVATDSHNITTRLPSMQKSFEYIKKKYGENFTIKLFIENPSKIILNEYI